MTFTGIEVISRGKFLGIPDGIVVSLNPKMDLLAVSMNKMSVWVFRLSGERVYSVNNRSQIVHLCWNSSGKFFSISGSDGLVKVYDSNDGTLVNRFATNSALPITLTAWTSVNIEKSIGEDDYSPYLNMFHMDILQLMPKLSNEVQEVSSSTSSGMAPLDPHLKSLNPMSISMTSTNVDDSALDYLLVVNSDSLLTITFNNLFTVPDIELPLQCKFLHHSMAEDILSQYFLAQDNDKNLLLYKFRFDVSPLIRRKNVFDIIRWCSHLTSILNHATDQITNLKSSSANLYKYFDRQLSNLKDALYENVDLTTNFPTPQEVEDKIVQTLLHIFLTGETPENLHDYWLNQFGERALVRLSEEGNKVFDQHRKILFSQIILGFEKAIVILSEIEAVLKAAHDLYDETYSIELKVVASAMDQAQNIIQSVYDFIFAMNSEQEHFNLFLSWVKVEVLEKISKMDDLDLFYEDHLLGETEGPEVMKYVDKMMLRPKIISFLGLELPDNEVLVHNSTPDALLEKLVKDLRDLVQAELLPGFQKYMLGISSFDQLLKLSVDLPAETWSIHLHKETVVVPFCQDRSICILYFSKEEQHWQTQIELNEQIISFELVDSKRIITLSKDIESRYSLRIISLPDVQGVFSVELLPSETFRFDDAHISEPTFLSVSAIENPQKAQVCILGPTKREFMIFKILQSQLSN